MQKKNKTKTAITPKIIAATVVFLSAQGIPAMVHGQKPDSTTSIKVSPLLKYASQKLSRQKLTLVAMIEGVPVVKAPDGKIYLMDPENGEVRLVAKDEYNKLNHSKMVLGNEIFAAAKKAGGKKISIRLKDGEQLLRNQILLHGVDSDGHQIFENSKGAKFYFDPFTGDMIDFTAHIRELQ